MPLSRPCSGEGWPRLAVRLTPKGGADRVDGIVETASGLRQLKVRVCAVAEQGKANRALLKLLAKQFAVPVSRLRLIHGDKDPNKVVEIAADWDELTTRLASLVPIDQEKP